MVDSIDDTMQEIKIEDVLGKLEGIGNILEIFAYQYDNKANINSLEERLEKFTDVQKSAFIVASIRCRLVTGGGLYTKFVYWMIKRAKNPLSYVAAFHKAKNFMEFDCVVRNLVFGTCSDDPRAIGGYNKIQFEMIKCIAALILMDRYNEVLSVK